jgi:hypothetical protein
MGKIENLKNYKSFEDIQEKTYPKTFSVKLPVSVAKKMLELDTKERTLLMRRAIINELEKMFRRKETKNENQKISPGS